MLLIFRCKFLIGLATMDYFDSSFQLRILTSHKFCHFLRSSQQGRKKFDALPGLSFSHLGGFQSFWTKKIISLLFSKNIFFRNSQRNIFLLKLDFDHFQLNFASKIFEQKIRFDSAGIQPWNSQSIELTEKPLDQNVVIYCSKYS